MYKCERIDHCPFFKDQMVAMPQSSEIIKETFCRNEHEKCARQLVYAQCGSEHVPADLFPGELQRAREIVLKCKE